MARLIDADALIELLEEKMFNSEAMCPVIKITDVLEIVQEQPTAHDVEKVVEQLQEREETSKECYVEAMVEGIYSSVNRFCGERFAYNNAIELVRKGGVE